MKTTIKSITATFTAALLLLSLQHATAQHHLGVIGGINHADIKPITTSGKTQLTSPKIKPSVGLIYEYELNRHVSFNLEPMYQEKGGQIMANQTDPDIEVAMKYLEVPVLCKVSMGKKVKPFVKGGPAIGFLLDAEATTQPGLSSAGKAAVYKAKLNGMLTSVDVSFVLGVGVDIPIGRFRVFMEGRYTFGVQDIARGGQVNWTSPEDNFTVDSSPEGKISNRGLQVLAGVVLPLAN